MLSKSIIRKSLRKLADLIADEAERNTDFAAAIEQILHPKSGSDTGKKIFTLRNNSVTRAKTVAPDLPDPFNILRELGSTNFDEWLIDQDISTLKSIIKQYKLDPGRLSYRWKKKERLIQLISDRIQARSKQGDSFRNYNQ